MADSYSVSFFKPVFRLIPLNRREAPRNGSGAQSRAAKGG